MYLHYRYLIMVILMISTASTGQCLDNFIRPSDDFVLSSWSVRCQNGNDGIIDISNISSTAGNFTNQGFIIRILSGPTGTSNYAVPINESTFSITGLVAGTYTLDIMDQCGGNSSDKTIVVGSPSNYLTATFLMRNTFNNTSLSGCGNSVKYRFLFVAPGSSGDIELVLTNSANNTLIFNLPIARTKSAMNNSYSLDVEVPVAFFNGQDITYNASNLCSSFSGAISCPLNYDIVFGVPSINESSDPDNSCNLGFNIKIFRDYMVNPITVSVEESCNPGQAATNAFGEVLQPQSVNVAHLNSQPMGMATVVDLGLKYNTHYDITFTDACGKEVVKHVIQNGTPFDPALSCENGLVTDSGGFFDDVAFINFNGLPYSSQSVGPLTITVNSGPSTYTTSNGTGGSVITSPIQYPYVVNFSSPYAYMLIEKDNVKAFPSGNYNFTIEDACGKTANYSMNTSCVKDYTLSHHINYCEEVSDSLEVRINIPKALFGTYAAIYKSDGTLVYSDKIQVGPPFNFQPVAQTGRIYLTLQNNETYFFRYGGVDGFGTAVYPTQLGGSNLNTRLQGGFLYEYQFSINLEPFHFDSIIACETTVELEATGGTAPYKYSLYDSTGNTLLENYQDSNIFSGLTVGMTYLAKTRDNCGREFAQPFTVYAAPDPTFQIVNQPSCNTSNGVVLFENLPTDWTITNVDTNEEYNGATATFNLENLPGQIYNFEVKDNDTNCTSTSFLTIYLFSENCPESHDDVFYCSDSDSDYVIDVLQNDNTSIGLDMQSINLIAPNNATSFVYQWGLVKGFTVPSEGVWSVDDVVGKVHFTKFPSALSITSVAYTVKDIEGNLANQASIYFDCLPIAIDDVGFYTVGQSVTLPILDNDTSGSVVDPSTVVLLSNQGNATSTTAELTLQIPAEGTWSVDLTNGQTTFLPETGFSGLPSSIQYTVEDFDGNVSNVATISLIENDCDIQVTIPSFSLEHVQCYGEIPTQESLSVEDFMALGDQTGQVSSSCGVIVITAENEGVNGCNQVITRTYHIVIYDNQSNVTNNTAEILYETEFTQQFLIQDTIPPQFTSTVPATIVLSPTDEIPSSDTVSVTDNCSEVQIDFNEETIEGTCETEMNIIRTWIATDWCGNVSSYTQEIIIQDNTYPEFYPDRLETLYLSCETTLPEVDVTALDNGQPIAVTYEEEKIEGDCSSFYRINRKWKAVDGCGNINILEQTVEVTCDINVYNALSPDGDGINDYLILEGIECFPDNQVTIFDRWGSIVFETHGYDNSLNVFKGRAQSGMRVDTKALPTGTYYYIITYNAPIENNFEDKKKTGYLYINQ